MSSAMASELPGAGVAAAGPLDPSGAAELVLSGDPQPAANTIASSRGAMGRRVPPSTEIAPWRRLGAARVRTDRNPPRPNPNRHVWCEHRHGGCAPRSVWCARCSRTDEFSRTGPKRGRLARPVHQECGSRAAQHGYRARAAVWCCPCSNRPESAAAGPELARLVHPQFHDRSNRAQPGRNAVDSHPRCTKSAASGAFIGLRRSTSDRPGPRRPLPSRR